MHAECISIAKYNGKTTAVCKLDMLCVSKYLREVNQLPNDQFLAFNASLSWPGTELEAEVDHPQRNEAENMW